MFQQISNTLGQKTDDGYQTKTAILATISKVKDVEYSQKTGKAKQGLLLKADNGEEEWVNLMGKDCPIDKTLAGKRYEFLVWPYKAEQAPKITYYCWIQKQVFQNTPQQAPQPLQAPKAQQGVQSAPQNKDGSICRQTAGKCAAEIIAANLNSSSQTEPILVTFFDIAEPIAKWFETGEKPKHSITAEPVDEEQALDEALAAQEAPTGDEIPF